MKKQENVNLEDVLNKLRSGLLVQLCEESNYECVGVVVMVDNELLVLDKCQEVKTRKREMGKQDFLIRNLRAISILDTVQSCRYSEIIFDQDSQLSVQERNRQQRYPWFVRKNPHLNRREQFELYDVLLAQETKDDNLQKAYLSLEVDDDQYRDDKKELNVPSFTLSLPRQRHTQRSESNRDRRFAFLEKVRGVYWPSESTLPILKNMTTKVYFVATKEHLNMAMEYLEKKGRRNVVGVSVEGHLVSRFGIVSLLCLSTVDSIVVFDVFTLDDNDLKLFFEGVFHNQSTLKIIHDARQLSDWLFNKFNVELTNVYDTLAAHNYFMMLSGVYGQCKVPMYASSISALSRAYFGIDGRDLFYPRIRCHCSKTDSQPWFERPINHSLLLGAVQNVRFLLDLYEATQYCIMKPCKDGTTALIKSVRQADDKEAEMALKEPQRLPRSHQEALLSNFVTNKMGVVGYFDTDKNLIHNSVGHMDPEVIFSRDVMSRGEKR